MADDEELKTLNEYVRENLNLYGVWNSFENVTSSINKANEDLLGFDKCDTKTQPSSILPVTLTCDDVLGKYFIAARDIQPGEPLLIEKPAVKAPLIASPISKAKSVCIKCCQTCGDFFCQQCGFYFCSSGCLDESHDLECSYLQRLNIRDDCDRLTLLQQKLAANGNADVSDEIKGNILIAALMSSSLTKTTYTLKQYCLLGPLRTVLTMIGNVRLKALIDTLKSDAPTEAGKRFIRENQIANDVFNLMEMSHSLELIQRIITIWNTNGFKIGANDSKGAQGLYIFASYFNHSCAPNAEQWFLQDGTIVIRSTESIRQGETIFITYNNLLWPTRIRVNHLESTKHFTCDCKRCSDPTECGTFIGSIFCNICKDYYLPVEHPTYLKTNWKCRTCGDVKSARDVNQIDVKIAKLIQTTQNWGIDREPEMNVEQFHCQYHSPFQFRLFSIRKTLAKKLSDEELQALELEAKSVYETISALFATYSRQRAAVGKLYMLICYEKLKRQQGEDQVIIIPEEYNTIIAETTMVARWNPVYATDFFAAFGEK